MNFQHFISTFALIFIAELPDKTFFATLFMASRGRPLPIFIGASAAFFVQCLVAVVGGSVLSTLPQRWVLVAAGVMFLIFAVISWRYRPGPVVDAGHMAIQKGVSVWRGIGGAFAVVFIAEWGDTTQLASASLVAQGYSPWIVLSASVLALWTVAGLAVTVGARAKDRLPIAKLKRFAAVIFAGIGLYCLLKSMRS